jgi:hypothetical protein
MVRKISYRKKPVKGVNIDGSVRKKVAERKDGFNLDGSLRKRTATVLREPGFNLDGSLRKRTATVLREPGFNLDGSLRKPRACKVELQAHKRKKVRRRKRGFNLDGSARKEYVAQPKPPSFSSVQMVATRPPMEEPITHDNERNAKFRASVKSRLDAEFLKKPKKKTDNDCDWVNGYPVIIHPLLC